MTTTTTNCGVLIERDQRGVFLFFFCSVACAEMGVQSWVERERFILLPRNIYDYHC
jgi:endogenous inhibitor of DNA gyrase (YacG/DUF329 family)